MQALGFLLIVVVGSPAGSTEEPVEIEPAPWIAQARDLFTGDESKAEQSKKWFQKHPQQLTYLADHLSQLEESHLALDTLVALNYEPVIPYLLENLRQNKDGSYALALAAFLRAENARTILSKFKRLIETEALKLSPSLLLPMFDTLARLKVPLSESTLKNLILHPWPEVRSSLVLYLRHSLLAQEAPPSWLMETLTQDPAYQVRLGVLYLSKEFPEQTPDGLLPKACAQEAHASIVAFCQHLALEKEP